MAYDERCYDLAAEFLADHGDDSEFTRAALAQVIQDAIEQFLEAD